MLICVDEKTKTILKWLSTSDAKTKQEEVLGKREKGTGMWLLETQEFKDWFDGKHKVLWGWGGRKFLQAILSVTR